MVRPHRGAVLRLGLARSQPMWVAHPVFLLIGSERPDISTGDVLDHAVVLMEEVHNVLMRPKRRNFKLLRPQVRSASELTLIGIWPTFASPRPPRNFVDHMSHVTYLPDHP